MRLLGTGELAGLKARGVGKLERDLLLRNERIRVERQRAHLRALIAVPPKNFAPGTLGRIAVFLVQLVRVAPLQHQLAADELGRSLEPIAQGIADHLRRCRFEYSQEVGPWSVRFTVFEDGQAFIDSSDEAAASPTLTSVDSPEGD